MKPAPFAYIRPRTVQEACEVLSQERDAARILAGGQSLGAMLNMRIATPSALIDINRIEGLGRIEESGGTIITGATVRQTAALAHPSIQTKVPLLAEALPHVGHYQTRSRGTLAGSAAHADPSAEIPLVLAVLGGTVELAARAKRRLLSARDFFVSALTTQRRDDEMVVALRWPVAKPGAYYGFREFALRAGDYAIAAAACSAIPGTAEDASRYTIGFAGCAGAPQIVEFALPRGADSAKDIAERAEAAVKSIECWGDLHASEAYRRNLAAKLCLELMLEAAGHLKRSQRDA
jgi:2-furoyl-CoA dehydrogenase FAD binding subunit